MWNATMYHIYSHDFNILEGFEKVKEFFLFSELYLFGVEFIGTPGILRGKSAIYGNLKYAICVALAFGMLVIGPIQIAFA